MRTVTIGSVVRPVSTWHPRRKAGRPFRYIDLAAIDPDLKEVTGDRVLAASEAPARARQLVAAGDVLVSTVRPNLNGVARITPRLDGATASTAFCVLRPSARVDSGFLFHWLRSASFVADMTGQATGQSYPAVSHRVVRDSLMPLPDLPEQRRIAEVLDRADRLRARRAEVMDELRALSASVFADLLGDAPKPLPTVTVGEICEVRGGKRLPRNAPYASTPTAFRYIRVTDLRDGRIAEHDLRHLDPATQRAVSRYTVDTGDVLLSIAGTVGVVAVVPESVAGANLTENAARLTPRDGRCLPEFLCHMLRTDHVQEQIRGHTGRATVGKLALFRVAKLRFPLPPVGLQKEVVVRLAEIDRLREINVRSRTEVGALSAALRDRAFGGEW